MDYLNLKEFTQECDEVYEENDLIEFVNYSNRENYHINREYKTYQFEDVIKLVHQFKEEYDECETDGQRLEFISDVLTGDGGGSLDSCDSDNTTISYTTPYWTHIVDDTPIESYMKGVDKVVWVEDYPYKGGVYSGTLNTKTLEVKEIEVEESSSCMGGEGLWIVPPSILSEI